MIETDQVTLRAPTVFEIDFNGSENNWTVERSQRTTYKLWEVDALSEFVNYISGRRAYSARDWLCGVPNHKLARLSEFPGLVTSRGNKNHWAVSAIYAAIAVDLDRGNRDARNFKSATNSTVAATEAVERSI